MWNYINSLEMHWWYAVSFSCLVNDTEELGPLMTVNISADSNKLHLQDLEALSKYKFYLRCCTREGCGPAASEERTTVPEASEYGAAAAQGWGLLWGVSLWHSKGQGIWLSDMDDQVAVVMGIDPANAGDIISTSHLTKLFICPSKHFFIAKQYHNSVRLGCIHHCLGRPSTYWFEGKSLPAKRKKK